MNKLTCFLTDFINDENGLTAVEYAIAGGLGVGCMVTVFLTLGNNATDQITKLSCAANGTTYVAPVADDPATANTDESADATCS